MEVKRVVLGAEDPEMVQIEALARALELEVVYAQGASGRVTPAEARKAGGPVPQAEDLWVEAHMESPAFRELRDDGLLVVADHHAHGDPGYGVPPGGAVGASSIGQVIAALAVRIVEAAGSRSEAWVRYAESGGDDWVVVHPIVAGKDFPPHDSGAWRSWGWGWTVGEEGMQHAYFTASAIFMIIPPRAIVATGALDHCRVAALRGMVPGLTAEAAREHSYRVRGSTPEQEAAADAALAGGPRLALGESMEVVDLRGREGLPYLADAAAAAGVAYILDVVEPGGRLKVVLGGAGEGSAPGVEVVNAFMAWARARPGLEGFYGDPVRGFAGAYYRD